ncbi:MAG: beta-ketoacyl-ACP synthase I [SAR86 cluster bacterium]|jgi:3-oxoacyl-[acyl-carrier-protein] synthase-1|uniref:3-oxoacyl-[acyl-carrier-protein] synthase 1 n=1 Tax=SAR86 cluster bacterium TaxID=2030880 RepID=A0A520N522_9GAMM|nr:MAG: beta-ketoacyl-ACP synthase I [SAR86 cluster bacterium]
MRNVVITGVGIKSCIGNDYAEVLANLQNAKSGIVFNEKYSEMGFRSCVSGSVNIDLSEHIDRKLLRFMGESAGYAYLATKDALKMAGIDESHLDSPKIGIVAGSGGASTRVMLESGDIAREKGPKRIGPYGVTKSMSSSISAIIATALKLKGINYSISSACATSAHCIGHAADLIKSGEQDVVIAGGSDDEHWSSSCLFDAMGALSSNFNSTPTIASRPYDSNRDGFVISGGAGMIILEDEEHAKKRGANILAKLSGYFANSDGYDMVAPSGEGASRCMQGAIDNSKIKIDYINTHGTSTPVGDVAEINAIKTLFNSETPMISSTKSMTGHSLGATGAHEAIYSIMMINENFIAPSINIESLCDDAEGLDIVTETRNTSINNVLSNSFGFGGTNASLVISRYQ